MSIRHPQGFQKVQVMIGAPGIPIVWIPTKGKNRAIVIPRDSQTVHSRALGYRLQALIPKEKN